MRVVIACSEAVPFSKTGGLADVASALPKALSAAGHEASIIVPYYPRVQARDSEALDIVPTGITLRVPVGQKVVEAKILQSKLPGTNVAVYLIDQADYFHRSGIYVENGQDYRDNCERFVFFSRAVIEAIQHLQLRPHVIHANDWQTGLIPALVSIEMRHIAGYEQQASIFTIHNMAFQGRFWHWDMNLTRLDWKYFNWREMEFFGHLNLLKTGVAFADMITTVSPTYAREIQTPELSYGLHGTMTSRKDDLVGILNGVDTEIWNPATDSQIASKYTADTVVEGKAACKAALQKRLGLPVRPDVMLLGSVSRMTSQKGFSLIGQCSELLLEQDVQLAFLGNGDPRFEAMLSQLAVEHPDKVSTTIGYDEALSHQVEAGCDVFLMPSEFEPCGLNQMYSLIYGTVPIVRAVGGLADSVIDASDANRANGTANGFSFHDFRGDALFWNICRARSLFADKAAWLRLQQSGMRRDWSWKRSAIEYLQVYERAVARRRRESECDGIEK
ncbi:MAG: glycogen synthase GlgA [Planctomycetaceae bacterium]